MGYRGTPRVKWAAALMGSASATLLLAGADPARAASSGPVLPEIRSSAANPVPACVTPDRLMSFLREHNRSLDPRYRDIANNYKKLGEAWRVRWDYAFYQMVIETNFLTYRTGEGRMGDVDPKQNNFAGIGTTGGGVPGDGFPDVKTGVLAQMQHLVAYSGEKIAAPVASRTQLKQDDIIDASRDLGRPVRFSDLSHRWAVDRNYGRSIEWAADMYRDKYCKGANAVVADAKTSEPPATEVLPWLAKESTGDKRLKVGEMHLGSPSAPEPLAADAAKAPSTAAKATAVKAEAEPAKPDIKMASVKAAAAPAATAPAASSEAPKSSPVKTVWSSEAPKPEPRTAAAAGPPVAALGVSAAAADKCQIRTASYGGTKTLLLRSNAGGATRYTALTVLDGFEASMTSTFLTTEPAGGEKVAEFPSKAAALTKARELCQAGS